MQKSFWKVLPTVGMLLCLNVFAQAGTVTAQFHTVSPNRILKFTLDGVESNALTYSGEFNWTRIGGDHVGDPSGDFVAFCVELTQGIGFNGIYTYDVVPLENAPDPGGFGVGNGMGAEKADMIRELWGRHYAEIIDSDSAAAFQLAVWEVVYDEGRSVTDGAFRAIMPGYDAHADTYVPLAQAWLNSIDGHGPKANIGALSNPHVQDQIFFQSGPGGEVPVPSAVWAGMALLGGLVCKRAHQSASHRAE